MFSTRPIIDYLEVFRRSYQDWISWAYSYSNQLHFISHYIWPCLLLRPLFSDFGIINNFFLDFPLCLAFPYFFDFETSESGMLIFLMYFHYFLESKSEILNFSWLFPCSSAPNLRDSELKNRKCFSLCNLEYVGICVKPSKYYFSLSFSLFDCLSSFVKMSIFQHCNFQVIEYLT